MKSQKEGKEVYYSLDDEHVAEILQQNERILDIGYGNGYLVQKLYKKQVVDLYSALYIYVNTR